MSSLNQKKALPKSQDNSKVQTYENAYILPAAMGDRLVMFLQEMPFKYHQELKPLLEQLTKGPRGNISFTVNPPLEQHQTPKQDTDA